jgi:hypothetical protein
MDGESRQLLVYPVMNTSLHWLRQARPSGEVWPKQKNGIVSRPGCGRLRDERAPGLALLRPCRAIGGGVVTASTRFDAGARETTPPPGPAASTATRVRAARGVVVVTAWSR